MFSTKGSSSYGKGIASNLVTEEERQKYNSGGRVGLWNGSDYSHPPVERIHTYDRPTSFGENPQFYRRLPPGTPVDPTAMHKINPLDLEDMYTRENLYPKWEKSWKKPKNWDELPQWEGTDLLGPYMESEEAEMMKLKEADPVQFEKLYETWAEDEYGAKKRKQKELFESAGITSDFLDDKPGLVSPDTGASTYARKAIDKGTFTEDTLFGGKEPYTFEGEEGDTESLEEPIDESIRITELDPWTDPRSNVEKLKDKLAKDLGQAKTRGKVAAAAQGVKMASALLTEPTWAKAIGKAGSQAPELVQAAYAPQEAAKKTERQFEMLEALQEQKGDQALEKVFAEWGQRKDVYEFLDMNAKEAAEKSQEFKKELMEINKDYEHKPSSEKFKLFLADKGGDSFARALGLTAYGAGGTNYIAAEWQTMKPKKRLELYDKNKGNVIVDGQGHMVFIDKDGKDYTVTLKQLGLEDEGVTIDIPAITGKK
jgi:hypothetical protein